MIVLSGFGAFGALPPYTALTPQDEDCGIGGAFCWGKNFFLWGAGLGMEGLGPGSSVVNFAGRYKKAMSVSKMAESLPVGNALRTRGKKLDATLLSAIQDAYALFPWDMPICGPGPGKGRCRSPAREEALKAALPPISDALNAYDKLEAQLAPYLRQIEAEEAAAAAALTSSSSSGMSVDTGEPLWPKLLMYGIPAAVLLIGGAAVLLKKPKARPAAVAGYSRRRRRR